MRGRKPDPTAIRKQKGNPGKRKYNKREPKFKALAGFDVPPELEKNAIAAAEWVRLALILKRSRHVTEADRNALIALCLSWSQFVTADAHAYPAVIKGHRNPWTMVRRAALQDCIRLWPELGLTPSARTRIQTPETPPVDGDAFTEFDDAPSSPAPLPPKTEPTTH